MYCLFKTQSQKQQRQKGKAISPLIEVRKTCITCKRVVEYFSTPKISEPTRIKLSTFQ